MSIKNNTTSLQSLLEQVNSLPEAENLDTELSAQTTLIAEQDAKIAELAQVLAGKAGGDDSYTTDTITLVNNTGAAVFCGASYINNGESVLIPLKLTSNAVQITIVATTISSLSCTSTSGNVVTVFYNTVDLGMDGGITGSRFFVALPYIMNITAGSTVTITT